MTEQTTFMRVEKADHTKIVCTQTSKKTEPECLATLNLRSGKNIYAIILVLCPLFSIIRLHLRDYVTLTCYGKQYSRQFQ